MVRVALKLGIVGLMVATPLVAAERLSLYSDPAMTNCALLDDVPGLKVVYVGQETFVGAIASQFRVRTPDCWIGASFVSSAPAPGFGAIGNAPDDMIVTYDVCYSGAFLVATITYLSTAEPSPCCWIYLEKGPSAPLDGIVSLDCTFIPHVVTGSFRLIINPDVSCLCSNPARSSTWGSLKALYR
jgi:hypothetical protein